LWKNLPRRGVREREREKQVASCRKQGWERGERERGIVAFLIGRLANYPARLLTTKKNASKSSENHRVGWGLVFWAAAGNTV